MSEHEVHELTTHLVAALSRAIGWAAPLDEKSTIEVEGHAVRVKEIARLLRKRGVQVLSPGK